MTTRSIDPKDRLAGCRRSTSWVLAMMATVLAAPVLAAPAQPQDPLSALPQAEITVHFDQANIRGVLRALAGMSGVPFILDFEPGDLSVSVKAEKVPMRTVLQTLAGSARLQYELTEAGLVVRRAGSPSAAQPVTVGTWGASPLAPGPLYRLELEAREPTGTVLTPPPVLLPLDSLRTVRQASKNARQVTALNSEKLVAEPRAVGAVQVNVCVKKESSAGLDLLLEVVIDRPVSAGRYASDHVTVTRTVAPGEHVLFESEDGYQLILKNWSRVK